MKTINSPVRIYNAMYSFNYASRILRMFCVPRLILVYKNIVFSVFLVYIHDILALALNRVQKT